MITNSECNRQRFKRNVFIRYFLEFRGLYKQVAIANLFAIIQALSLLPISLFFKTIIDTYIPEQNPIGILKIVLYGLVFWAIHIASTITGRYFCLYATKTVTERLRAKLTMKLQQMSLRFYDSERIGDLHARVVMDTEKVDVMANAVVVHIFVSVIVTICSSILLFVINPKLLILVLILIPLYYIVQRSFAPKLKYGHGEFRNDMEKMSSIVSEVLHSIRLVKSFATETYEQNRMEEKIKQVTNRGVKLFTFTAAFQILLQFIGGLAALAIFTIGGWMVINGDMSIGDVIAFSTILGLCLTPINTLISCSDILYSGRAGLVSIYSLLDMFDTEETNHLPDANVTGIVNFQNVTFSYDGHNPVLDNISIQVNHGEQIAFVGASGSGKTTLMNLLLGFYKPESGDIIIGSQPIKEISLRSLREQIGVVSQDNVLINDSIMNNILYGKMTAEKSEIINAAKLANAHNFITELPQGYETSIGERGAKLSGGQKQRIAIARAILKDPKILILDEATSALDSESELAVQEALDTLRNNRTSFVIAHRLSTIKNADKIVVLNKGKIVESGTFNELLDRKQEFYKYYTIQFAKEESPKQVSQLA